MRKPLLGGALLLVAGLVPALAPPLRAAVDPFYTTRLQEGIVAAERGAWADAARSLRTACFGMLDDPAQLSPCLVRLALAQAGAGDREGFAQTYDRIAEGEQLVGLYTRHAPPRELAAPFEARVAEWIPRAALAATPAFARLAADPREAQLAGLDPRARREKLEKLEKQEPRDSRWPLLLARLAREQGDAKPALGAAERALRVEPQLVEAHCVRAWALGQLGRAADAAADVAACPAAAGAVRAAQAPATVAASPPQTQTRPQTRPAPAATPRPATPPATAAAARGAAPSGVRPAPAAASPPPAGPAAAPAAAAPPQAAAALSAAEEATLQRATTQLAAARTSAEVEQAYALIADLAARHPHDARVQLAAGEIAYRASRWVDAVRHFRLGDPGDDRPLLVFYYAVALWESGDRQNAAVVLRRTEGKLRPTPFVQSYRAKILGVPPSAPGGASER